MTDPTVPQPTWPADRPVLNVNKIVYFEQLTRDRARGIFSDGGCEIYDFKTVTANIQRLQHCENFQAIPCHGQVVGYINLYYLEFFERVQCESKERYRAHLLVAHPSCATTHCLADCGVGLFSVHVYRKLRRMMERFNPHTDFKYRRTVKLEECEC